MSHKSRLTWRVNEIVIVSVVAVACAVVFWVWDIGVSPAAKTIFAAVPEYQPLIGGAWLLAGVLGGYLIRKPGAALYCEVVAAFISVLLTGALSAVRFCWRASSRVWVPKFAFAVFAYRRWNLPVAVFAGALAGLFMGGNEILIYYPDMDPTKAAIYIVCSVLSGLVMSGIGSWALTKALAKTGVLASLASGAQARTVQA